MNKVIFLLPDLGSGGAERVVSLISNEFVGRGVNVSILLLFGQRIIYPIDDRVQVITCALRPLSKWNQIVALRRLLRQQCLHHEKVVAIGFQESCLKLLVFASWHLPIKVVATERNDPFQKGNNWICKMIASWPFLLSDISVFQTPDARDYYSMLAKRKCFVIPNPISVSKVKWRGNVSAHNLITICRLHPQKNLPMAISVVEKLKEKYSDVSLEIFGEGPLGNFLNEQIEKKGLCNNIKLRGVTKDVQSCIAESSIFILTSDYEGISNSMLEAMSVGIPSICTECPIGGAKMMLKDGAGILSPVGDSKVFSSQIEFLFENPDKAVEMGHKALMRSKDYSIGRIVDKWQIILFNE